MRVPVTGGASEVLTTIRKGFPHCSARGRCVVLDYQGSQIVISEIDPLRGKGAELARIPETFGGYLLPDGNAFAMKDGPSVCTGRRCGRSQACLASAGT